jgi:Ca2+-transporting ATPase
VLARWPAAVESLGSATVLAVDKTGTLTENRMAVQQLLTWPELQRWQAGSGLEEPFHRLLELAVLASRGDPVDAMELAIQRLATAQLGGSEHLHPDWPLERDYPLQSDLLVFSQLWSDGNGGRHIAAKGAPEAIADLCHLQGEAMARFLQAADDLAAQGLRVLAVASGLDGAPLHAGLQPPLDPGEPPAGVHDFPFTPLGLLVVERARAALASLEVVAETAQSARASLSGPLRLGIIPTIGPFLLPRLMQAMRVVPGVAQVEEF